MKIEITKDKDSMTGRLTGRLDNASVAQFTQSIETLTAQTGHSVILDCAGLQFISLRGLQLFRWLQDSVQRQGGHFSMRNVAATIMQILTATGFATLLNLE